jgi:uncharacterized membrane protein
MFGKLLTTFLIAMVPVIELRGAIPVATAEGVPLVPAIVTAVIGNLIPVPFIILFVRKVFAWMRGRNEKLNAFVTRLENRAMSKADSVQKYEFWGLALFVAIPLPGTGAWTGALIAALLDMQPLKAFLSVALGVIGAGFIVAFVSYGAAALIF